MSVQIPLVGGDAQSKSDDKGRITTFHLSAGMQMVCGRFDILPSRCSHRLISNTVTDC